MYEINYNRIFNIKLRRPKMYATNIYTYEKYFHNILHITNAYNSHYIRNNARDGEWKKNDLLSDRASVANSKVVSRLLSTC